MGLASSPTVASGLARTLLALRHALADPLSSASLKLDLVERRLTAPSGADPTRTTEHVKAAREDVNTASRLLDLLLRLAEIAGEQPIQTSLRDVCRVAGVSLEEPVDLPSLPLRQRSSADAIQSVASFEARGDDAPSLRARAAFESGRVTLTIEGSRATDDGMPERLLALPHGIEDAEPLFVARAAVEADGGRLELAERGGRLVALFSWPVAERTDGA
jgi:hypothetical protein